MVWKKIGFRIMLLLALPLLMAGFTIAYIIACIGFTIELWNGEGIE